MSEDTKTTRDIKKWCIEVLVGQGRSLEFSKNLLDDSLFYPCPTFSFELDSK